MQKPRYFNILSIIFNPMAKLFVVGFSREMDEISLLELFTTYCTVGTLTIVRDQDTNESRCFGFVTVLDPAGAKRAIEALDGIVIDGRTISVRLTGNETPQKQEPVRPFSRKPDQGSKIQRAKRPRR
jgi:RNA recognition motif-containing protein